MARALPEFPNEIADRIFGYIDSPRTLADIRQCSRQADIAVSPFLYGNLIFLSRLNSRGVDGLKEILKLISRNPERPNRPDAAPMIKHLTIKRHISDLEPFDSWDSGARPMSEEEKEALSLARLCVRELVNDTTLSPVDREFWQSTLNEASRLEILLPTVLSRLSNLETLDLTLGGFEHFTEYSNHSPFNRILQQSFERTQRGEAPLILPSLKSIFYTCGVGRVEMGIQWFCLPQVRSICLSRVWIPQPDNHLLRPSSLGLERVELRDCYIDLNSLQPLIVACQGLKTFVLDRAFHSTATPSSPWEDLRVSLETQAESLEELWLHSSLPSEPRRFVVSHDGHVPSFLPFKALKHIRYICAWLVDPNAPGMTDAEADDIGSTLNRPEMAKFPTSLEVLHLTKCLGLQDKFYSLVRSILNDKQSLVLPNLREIIIEIREEKLLPVGKRALGRSKSYAKSLGVEMTVLDSRRDYIKCGEDGYVEERWGVDDRTGRGMVSGESNLGWRLRPLRFLVLGGPGSCLSLFVDSTFTVHET